VRLILWACVVGCGGKSDGGPPPLPVFADTGAAGDSDDGTPDDSGEGGADSGEPFCADAPLVNWVNFGEGFILEACQGCHATETPNRYGAPEDVVFDTVALAWEEADRILARAGGDYPTMPPLGGSSADDRLKLRYWLECAIPGT
jgi:hypothetical protein